MNRYFITGTDTNCGKTYVTCQLVDYFKRKGEQALGIKPVASGCIELEGKLYSEDVRCLQQSNGDNPMPICRWHFKPPISPHLAAKEVNQEITIEELKDFCYQFREIDPLFIEGAGGLMAPLNANETWVDFLSFSKIPVILVVGMRLGCLNHALLTASVLENHGIACVGWVANCIDPTMLALSANIDTLSKLLSYPRLATIPFSETVDFASF